jgi:thiamine-phosphate pyrophosphorylase
MSFFKLPQIYPITDRTISGLSHAEQVRWLIDAGADFIQLREKHLEPREFYTDALEAVDFAHQNGARVIINDRADIAAATGADGVHLGQTDMPPAAAREFLGPDAIIGYSTHSIEQAVEAASMAIDYIAIGPVFATATKENPDPVVGLDGIKSVRNRVGTILLVAIGGIDASNLAAVIEAGAASAAVISSILRGDIRANFNLLHNTLAC